MLKNNSSFLDLLIHSSKFCINEDELLSNEGIIMNLLVAGSDEIYKSSIASHSHENKTDSNSKYQSLYILMLLSFDNQYATQMVFNNDVIGFLILYLSENKFNPHNPIEKEFPILSRRIIRNITSFGIYIYIYIV